MLPSCLQPGWLTFSLVALLTALDDYEIFRLERWEGVPYKRGRLE